VDSITVFAIRAVYQSLEWHTDGKDYSIKKWLWNKACLSALLINSMEYSVPGQIPGLVR